MYLMLIITGSPNSILMASSSQNGERLVMARASLKVLTVSPLIVVAMSMCQIFLNNKIQKFTSTGGFITSWGSSGSSDGQFNAPHGIAVDSDNSVYVSDRGNNRVQKFNNAGGFLTKFGSACTIQPCPKDGQFNGPDGIGISSSGSVYVTDIGNNRVQDLQ